MPGRDRSGGTLPDRVAIAIQAQAFGRSQGLLAVAARDQIQQNLGRRLAAQEGDGVDQGAA